jgi:hypothetical protein
MHQPQNRAVDQIKQVVDQLQLNLNGRVVLTEAGSGAFLHTPIIALFAGAEHVFAWTRDSSYGKGADIVALCTDLLRKLELDESRITFAVNERPSEHIAQADLVTNLGFVRPLDHAFLTAMKPGAVISYMSEAWELREGDIDVAFCKQNGIKLAGTWENHPDLRIFDACGPLIVKLCLTAGYEIYQNKIVVISNDQFGKVACDALAALKPDEVTLCSVEEAKARRNWNVDFVVLADYTTPVDFIGPEGILPVHLMNTCGIVHLAGKLDLAWAEEAGMNVFPRKNGEGHRMTETLAYLGTKPVVDLHAAGLKVGELLLDNKTDRLIQPIC